MTDESLAKNPNELLKEIEKASLNSPLDGIHEIYNKYYHLIEFIFDYGDSITKNAFMSESGFIGTNINYDGHKLFMHIKKTDYMSVDDFCYFSVDLLNFIINKLDSVCKSNTEVIDVLSNFSQRYKYGSYNETYNSFVMGYRNLRETKEKTDSEFLDDSDSDILLLQFFSTMRNFFKVMVAHISWGDKELNIGDIIRYNVSRNKNNDKYEIVCEITDEKYNEQFDVNVYDYKIISYDSHFLDMYPNYWLFEYEDKDKFIEPIHSSYISIL